MVCVLLGRWEGGLGERRGGGVGCWVVDGWEGEGGLVGVGTH